MTKRRYYGFTIVELLVVIVVIGVLAGLTYAGFGAWRTRVANTETKSDLTGVQAAMKSARSWGSGYPVLTPNTLFDGNAATKNIFVSGTNVTLTYISGDANSYCINGRSKVVPSVQYFLNTASGNTTVQPGTC